MSTTHAIAVTGHRADLASCKPRVCTMRAGSLHGERGARRAQGARVMWANSCNLNKIEGIPLHFKNVRVNRADAGSGTRTHISTKHESAHGSGLRGAFDGRISKLRLLSFLLAMESAHGSGLRRAFDGRISKLRLPRFLSGMVGCSV